jgi:protocatechuate 3,4-dioxygenase, beta subunit
MDVNPSRGESRRSFLRRAAVAAIALPVLPLGVLELAGCGSAGGEGRVESARAEAEKDCEWCGAPDAPSNVSWQSEMVPEGEPGEQLVMSGTIYEPDGKTPAKGILLYVYNTDAKGLYRSREGEHQHGRLRGWMRTDASGRYEFHTIKPASYPGLASPPAHIHTTLSGPGYPEYWIDSYQFDDDPRLTDRHRRSLSGRGGFNSIVKLSRDASGLWRGARDIRLERVAG